jgi:hypothetical protein
MSERKVNRFFSFKKNLRHFQWQFSLDFCSSSRFCVFFSDGSSEIFYQQKRQKIQEGNAFCIRGSIMSRRGEIAEVQIPPRFVSGAKTCLLACLLFNCPAHGK